MTALTLTATDWLRRNRTAAIAILSWIAFVIVAIAIYKITRDVRYDDVIYALANVPVQNLFYAIGLTAVSFAFLVCYDLNALHNIGRKLPLGPVAVVSLSAYAIGNTAGFGALSGGAIRYRGYGRLGLTGEDCARVIAFVTIAFGLGLTLMTGIALLFLADQVSGITGYPPRTLKRAAIIVLLVVASGLLVMWRSKERLGSIESGGAIFSSLPSLRDLGLQLIVIVGDVTAAGSVLYVLMPSGIQTDWPAFITLYCIAIGLGVLSHVPAGLGIFEGVILTGLGPDAPTEAVLGSLVLYRLVYHILPLFLAVIAMAVTEVLNYRSTMAAIWTAPISSAIVPPLLAMLAVICGVMLVFSAVLPTPQDNLDWLSDLIPIQILEAAHFISSVLGLLLIVVARGLVNRLDGAYWAGIVIAAIAMLFSLPKALALYEAIVLGLLILGLVLNRHVFTRHASIFADPLTPAWIGAIAMIVAAAIAILFFVYRDVDYSRQLWWQFEFSEEAPRGLRAMMGVSIAAVLLALGSLLRPARNRVKTTASPEEIARAVEITRTTHESAGNLVRMADKAVMFSEDGSAFLMYGIQGRSWIGLFGPIGPADAQAELIWRFVEAARSAGKRAVLYQVSPELLPACADAGLRALKLGEMARIDLVTMDLQTSRWGEPRRALNKGLREGMRLEVLEPEQIDDTLLGTLQQISDGWLAKHEAREKGFALGRFERGFVAAQPVAVLRANDRIVAFATLMVTDTKDEATVDLMRFADDAPKGTMDFLFVSLFVAMKERGFRHFNLGMAPLSGFVTHASAPVWNHVGQAIFTHGERFYNFKGLRAFKAKYNPDWEPRYLVVGQMSPVAALLDVTLLIGGGLKGVVGK